MQPTSEVLKAIETAIQIEKDGMAFYSGAARRTSDPRAKRKYELLAKDEAAHLRLFEDARKALLSRGAWLTPQEVAAVSSQNFEPASIFSSGDELEAKEMPEHELAALQRAIQAEEKSIAFYSEQRDKTEDSNAKAMYAYLIEQEKGHRAILQAEYAYLSRSNL
jgi:rubrerythrin